jgi:DNA-binding CsgD family transcriptional regulator
LRLEALELARQHGDTETLFWAAGHLLASGAPQHWGERIRLAEEVSGWPRLGASSQFLGVALFYCGMVWLAQGERARAEGARRELQELADRTRVATAGLFIAAIDSTLAIVDGRLEEAVERITRYVEHGDESGAPVRARQFGVMMLIAPARYLGRPDLWLTAADEYGSPATLARPGRPAAFFIQLTAMRAMCFAQLGRLDEGRALVGPLLDEVDGNPDNEVPIRVLLFLLEAAVVFEHRVAAEALAARLGCVSHITGEISPVQSVARRLGDAAVLRGDRVAARAYYLQALEVAGKIRFRPELALTHLRIAELSMDEGDDVESLQHLDLAIPELRDMKMAPALERAVALKDKLVPAVTPARQSASDVLTAREREIASLMSDGLSNHDIAERLVISEGTVEVHVKHILGKLGFRSRAQVAGWFARQESD